MLHFTLPLKTPVKPNELALEVFDPTFFVDFKLADKDPVQLVGAPAACKFDFQRPNDGAASAQANRRAEFYRWRQCQLRRDVRQQDHGDMSMNSNEGGARLGRSLAVGVLAVAAVLTADGLVHVLAAQTPFGGLAWLPETEQAGGLIGWLLAKQSEFYREMSSTIRAAKSDGSAVWALLAISFAYGIFHAAGPGHGKAVISSYLVANRETARRGIALSFVSAHVAVAGGRSDRRDRRVAAQCHRQDHVRG